MRDVFWNEVHRLRPHIRRNFLTGKQCYKDQQSDVRTEDEHLQRLSLAGITTHKGGHRYSKTLVQDTLPRAGIVKFDPEALSLDS